MRERERDNLVVVIGVREAGVGVGGGGGNMSGILLSTSFVDGCLHVGSYLYVDSCRIGQCVRRGLLMVIRPEFDEMLKS